MKKLLTLALALAALAASTGFSAGQEAQQKDKQKSPPTTTTHVSGDPHVDQRASPKVMTGTVTKVNSKRQTPKRDFGDRTFTVLTPNGAQVTFSAKEMKTLPAVGDVIDITYTQTPGGPPVATPTCCVKGSKSNGSERVLSQQGGTVDKDSKVMTGKVLRVNVKDNTFTIMAKGKEVTFFANKLTLPEVGKIMDITYTQTTPSGPLWSINLNSSRSNIY